MIVFVVDTEYDNFIEGGRQLKYCIVDFVRDLR
jgi:hypothetical protein